MQAPSGLTRKVGPLPVWAWAALGAIVVFYVFKHFSTGGASTAATSTQPTANTSTTGTGTAGGTSSPPASGQGSAIDQSTASLLGQMSGNLAYVNSNLVQGLLGSLSAIEGLGATALTQEGNIAQAVIYQQGSNSGSPSGTNTGGGGSGTGGGSSGGAATTSTWGPPTAVNGVPGGFVITSAKGGVAINAPVQSALAAPPARQTFKTAGGGYVG